jgi:hypothetical protein
MQRDEKRKPNAKYDQRDEEVTVGENCSCLWGNLHGVASGSDWLTQVNEHHDRGVMVRL